MMFGTKFTLVTEQVERVCATCSTKIPPGTVFCQADSELPETPAGERMILRFARCADQTACMQRLAAMFGSRMIFDRVRDRDLAQERWRREYQQAMLCSALAPEHSTFKTII